MSYDALTLAAVHDELTPLIGGRVQRVIHIDELTISLEIYHGSRKQVVLCAEANLPRIFLTDTTIRRGVQAPSPFYQLLHKYLSGARLTELTQPPLERVLEMGFTGSEGRVTLICELMGRYSNLVLVDENRTILDAIKRIPPSLNRYRSILPHQPYIPPPTQAKLNPCELTTEAMYGLLNPAPVKPVWRVLVEGISGISPLLAREISYRALGSADAVTHHPAQDAARLLDVVRQFVNLPVTHMWAPSVAMDPDGRVLSFAPYPLTHTGSCEPVQAISAAIERWLADRETFDAYRQVRQHLRQLLTEARDKLAAKSASLHKALLPPEQVEGLRHRANAILAMGWSIQPGQQVLELEPEMAASLLGTTGESGARIELDPHLSPAENAERLFDEYRHRQAANAEVPGLIAATEAELGYLSQLELDIDLAENRTELDALLLEIQSLTGTTATRRCPVNTRRILTVTAADRSLILVGRSAVQNEELTFRRASGDDLWLHARGVPGAHVIVKCGRSEPGDDTLNLAARYAAAFSAKRGETQVLVDYTRRRYVSRMPGGRPGMVVYHHERTLHVPGILEYDREPDNALQR